MENAETTYWRKCSACKKPIAFGARYYNCSVSTCNNQRTGYVFCSIPCFEVHLPGARHKDAAAVENTAPRSGGGGGTSKPSTIAPVAPAREPVRTIINSGAKSTPSSNALPREVLIIASRLKEYIQARSEMNTSAQVMDVLSDFVRVACDRAIDNARADSRKTVLDRDFQFLKRPL